MDEIIIKGLKLYGYHGVYNNEKKRGQFFEINVTLYLDTSNAGMGDNLDDTVNYAEACDFLAAEFEKNYVNLIETVANRLAKALLLKYPIVDSVDVEVCKPEAPIEESFDNVSVKIHRGRHTAIISVGSNMGDSKDTIEKAKETLLSSDDIFMKKEAKLISTKPYGLTNQPDFVNGMWVLETFLSPENLLKRLNEVEAQYGRERLVHWGPRTIDMDIIYYDDEIINKEKLTIPHKDMANREFVLKPLMEVAPYKLHPITHLSAEEMLKRLN